MNQALYAHMNNKIKKKNFLEHDAIQWAAQVNYKKQLISLLIASCFWQFHHSPTFLLFLSLEE
jgi:hypothetical protein